MVLVLLVVKGVCSVLVILIVLPVQSDTHLIVLILYNSALIAALAVYNVH